MSTDSEENENFGFFTKDEHKNLVRLTKNLKIATDFAYKGTGKATEGPVGVQGTGGSLDEK